MNNYDYAEFMSDKTIINADTGGLEWKFGSISSNLKNMLHKGCYYNTLLFLYNVPGTDANTYLILHKYNKFHGASVNIHIIPIHIINETVSDIDISGNELGNKLLSINNETNKTVSYMNKEGTNIQSKKNNNGFYKHYRAYNTTYFNTDQFIPVNKSFFEYTRYYEDSIENNNKEKHFNALNHTITVRFYESSNIVIKEDAFKEFYNEYKKDELSISVLFTRPNNKFIHGYYINDHVIKKNNIGDIIKDHNNKSEISKKRKFYKEIMESNDIKTRYQVASYANNQYKLSYHDIKRGDIPITRDCNMSYSSKEKKNLFIPMSEFETKKIGALIDHSILEYFTYVCIIALIFYILIYGTSNKRNKASMSKLVAVGIMFSISIIFFIVQESTSEESTSEESTSEESTSEESEKE